jgi:N-acyl-D-amino-acid deacylase
MLTRVTAVQIAKIVSEAVTAGALGFSTSRTMLHRDRNGTLVPGSLATDAELYVSRG